MASQTIEALSKLRLYYFKQEGHYASLRRKTEMEITEEHVKALEEHIKTLGYNPLPLGQYYDDVNPTAILYDRINPTPKRRDVFSDFPDKVNELTDPKSPIWTRPDEALHTFSGEGDRKATVHFNGDFYYVKLYEYGKLLDTRNLEGKSERYAEDCAENWVLSIMQIKKTAADNARLRNIPKKVNNITRNKARLEEFNEWRRSKHHP